MLTLEVAHAYLNVMQINDIILIIQNVTHISVVLLI